MVTSARLSPQSLAAALASARGRADHAQGREQDLANEADRLRERSKAQRRLAGDHAQDAERALEESSYGRADLEQAEMRHLLTAARAAETKADALDVERESQKSEEAKAQAEARRIQVLLQRLRLDDGVAASAPERRPRSKERPCCAAEDDVLEGEAGAVGGERADEPQQMQGEEHVRDDRRRLRVAQGRPAR